MYSLPSPHNLTSKFPCQRRAHSTALGSAHDGSLFTDTLATARITGRTRGRQRKQERQPARCGTVPSVSEAINRTTSHPP